MGSPGFGYKRAFGYPIDNRQLNKKRKPVLAPEGFNCTVTLALQNRYAGGFSGELGTAECICSRCQGACLMSHRTRLRHPDEVALADTPSQGNP
jgi:hypothetical protein